MCFGVDNRLKGEVEFFFFDYMLLLYVIVIYYC